MKIVLGVSGGIAAYKAPDLVRRLRDHGAAVRVILTPNAARFVSPLSLSAVSDHAVIVDQWGDPSRGGVDHIEIARWADLLLIAPATANILAKLAHGIADDALSTYAVAHRGRLALAPAMNTQMYRHPSVIHNLAILRERGAEILDPDSGLLACGDDGEGRMPDPLSIAEWVFRPGIQDLAGWRILITAGPTREPIDPVRYISNRSSGRMGYALARVARSRGARVTLVSGPVSIDPPADVELHRVTTSRQMHERVMELATDQDVIIKAAAVADWEMVSPEKGKLKKEGREGLRLELTPTPDILADLAKIEGRPYLVAFAAETDDVEANARTKLERKGADMIVANDVSDSTIGFDSIDNEVLILMPSGRSERVARAPKPEVASRILDRIVAEKEERDRG